MSMNKYIALLIFLVCISNPGAVEGNPKNPADEVNMLFGTDSPAQCPLTAARPFGMISPGPVNDLKTPCGLSYGRNYVLGFNHTHLQGTGCPGYGVVTLFPTTGRAVFGATSVFSPEKTEACPGYVKMELDSYNIRAEMTATLRTAIHRYTFPAADDARILIDCTIGTGVKPVYGEAERINSREISGYVTSEEWAKNTTYFYMQFSKDFQYSDESKGAYLSFATIEGEEIFVKVAISYVSAEQAKKNMDTEIPDWDFEAVRQNAYDEWNRELSRIEITGGTPDQRAIFYSTLYRAFFHPQTTNDVDGKYRGMDDRIHVATDHSHYSVLSTWDTFRAEHPLLNLIRPDVALDIIKTMLDDYVQFGWTPKWKLAYRETSCMPGAWACIIIPDSYMLGITDFDADLAWKAVYHDANFSNGVSGYENVDQYLSRGWIDGNISNTWNGTTRTLQHAYCDFGLYRFAGALNKPDAAKVFRERAYYCNNLWDENSGFFRGRHPDGTWVHEPFDPTYSHVNGHLDYGDYTEGNAWQYLFHQMQDLQDLINKLGGDVAFEKKLDECFAGEINEHNIGQYWHGNEPDQHYAYLYNYIGKPYKSADKIRLCLEKFYANNTWGLNGNDDAGQMSAWYVLSALGFYPVTHATGEFIIGSPVFESAVLHLDGGNFIIQARNTSDKNKYIQKATLNGRKWNKGYLPFSEMKNGGSLFLEMGSSVGSNWGTAKDARPYSMSLEKADRE